MDVKDYQDWTRWAGPQHLQFSTGPRTTNYWSPLVSIPPTAPTMPRNPGTYMNWQSNINVGSNQPHPHSQGPYHQGSYNQSPYYQNTHFQNPHYRNPYHRNPYYSDLNYHYGQNASFPRASPRPSNTGTTKSTSQAQLDSQSQSKRRDQIERLVYGAPLRKSSSNDEKEVETISPTSPGPQRRRRFERPPAEEVEIKLKAPLSELAKDLTDVSELDVVAFIYRSTEERHEEAAQVGKINRPVCQYLLYRIAYKNRIRELMKRGVLNGHGSLGLGAYMSKVSGKSWSMETQELRDKYQEWANINKKNHHIAFADYPAGASFPPRY
ncbi:hypothetical protein M434DRAFT_29444 [Hypoxylon sp. CO27-5]|nr:hypothetical protein M434DRAFT_29444 [Hypoxylon sp. CO27-5]